MCGRFSLTVTPEMLATHFDLAAPPRLENRFNIAPTQPVVIVRNATTGKREAVPAVWGLIPPWAKDPSIGNRLINARSETAAQKPAFRTAFRHRRCLIPSTGFYEWQKAKGGKRPFLIRLRSQELFAFAGLWEHWQGPGGEEIESCTILTTGPNALLREIHSRMPVILHPGEYDAWLGGETAEGALKGLLRPFPAEAIVAHPVSREVNNPRNDSRACVRPTGKQLGLFSEG